MTGLRGASTYAWESLLFGNHRPIQSTLRGTLWLYTHNVLTRNRNAGAQFLFLARAVQLKGDLRLWSGYSYVKQKLHAKYLPNEL